MYIGLTRRFSRFFLGCATHCGGLSVCFDQSCNNGTFKTTTKPSIAHAFSRNSYCYCQYSV